MRLCFITQVYLCGRAGGIYVYWWVCFCESILIIQHIQQHIPFSAFWLTSSVQHIQHILLISNILEKKDRDIVKKWLKTKVQNYLRKKDILSLLKSYEKYALKGKITIVIDKMNILLFSKSYRK